MDVSKLIFYPIQILSLCDVQCVPSAFLGVVNEAKIIFPVILFGCETQSLTLGGGGHTLRLFDKRLLRIFGPKRDGVREQWRRLHNEEFYDLCC